MSKRRQARGRGRTTTRSHLRISPQLLAAALRAKSAAVLIAARHPTKPGLKILFANASLCTLLGRTHAELDGHALDHLHADEGEPARIQAWLATAVPGAPLNGSGYLRRPDGTTFPASWHLDPLCNSRGRLTHLVATYADQTERRRLQETMIHAQRLEAVGRLAGGVAHDFNNLLSVINGYCEMLAARVAADPQAMREVTEIHHAGRKAAALTQQLLAFSRRQPFNAQVVNLNALLEENAAILQRLLGDAGELAFELAADLPNVRTDPAQFQQVILNLVLNARDALRDRGRVVVSTSCRQVSGEQNRRATDLPPGRYVVLSVADNGTGMDADTHRHLFEPFFTTKPEGKGTGLGLALVYGVVQQSGGDIQVQSALLVGSTFEILLPITEEPTAQPAPKVAPLPATRGHETVALIEEDEVVRKMVAGMLTADGYRVTAAGTFAELNREPPPERSVQLLIATPSRDTAKSGRRLLKANPALRFLCIRRCEESPATVPWLPAERQSSLLKPYALSEMIRATRRLLDA